jgi:hypothetical protein
MLVWPSAFGDLEERSCFQGLDFQRWAWKFVLSYHVRQLQLESTQFVMLPIACAPRVGENLRGRTPQGVRDRVLPGLTSSSTVTAYNLV